jgi:hypothetical protein
MTAEQVAVLSDAIKILGPATVTGIVGYLAARLQLVTKLKEIGRNQQFRAREHLFEFSIEMDRERRKTYDKIVEGMGQFMGIINTTQMAGDLLDENQQKTQIETISQVARSIVKPTQRDLQVVQRKMKRYGLDQTNEFSEISSYLSQLTDMSIEETFPGLLQAFLAFTEIYGHIDDCHEILMEKKRDEIFRSYTE